ncbi:transcriptional regulator, ArsR family [Anaerolinea thermolimosa]|uniref:ArsR/SmtB family transcription factor n=1 Tax=Anaerolinea thermolimosa TaxID=229919 RepID=UPI001EEE2408|nr:metalloregulator ArsR/SmtB family transcription factor [Anaerolinea thermolimosa]GAP06328.1 transcriptional regulator, ArsR family [Anaerolinea thermolimosa]
MNLNIMSAAISAIQPFEAQAQIFKVLSHPARIAILEILRDGEECVCHMEAYLGLRQAYISQQLAVLRESGIIQDRRDGWNIFYRVTDPRIFEVLDVVQRITGIEVPDVHQAGFHCTCPRCMTEQQVTNEEG